MLIMNRNLDPFGDDLNSLMAIAGMMVMRKMTLRGAFQGSSVRVRVRFQYLDITLLCSAVN